MRETLILDVPHRQVVFTIPRILRIFFKYNRRLLGSLCHCVFRSLTRYFEVTTGKELRPGVIAAIQTFGARIKDGWRGKWLPRASFSRTAKKQILLTSLPDGVILLATGDRTIGS